MTCTEWQEDEEIGTYVSAAHDRLLHQRLREAVTMLQEVDRTPSRFAEPEGDIDRLHDLVLRLEATL